MYSIAIYFYMFCVNIAALFNKKARMLMAGHRQTYRILREKILAEKQYIWFHAASLGEFEQGRPLIEKIRKEYPQYSILLTFFSPSGYEVRKNYEGADVVCYLPFDTALNARKFIRLARPCMAFFIKYEFWQNYLSALHRRHIPTFSVSSIFRPNQIFFRWYGRRYARVLHCFTHLFVQNEQSKELLQGQGINNVSVVGDTRFDRVIAVRDQSKPIPVAEAFVKAHKGAQILVAGSTWPPDEDILLSYFNLHPDQCLILAPHVVSESHIQDILSKIKRSAIRYTRATPENVGTAACLIIDHYGLLSSLYRYGELAYVGGGFGVGIHNIPEAAVYGIPVIIGPNNGNFREAQALLQQGACFEIHSADEYQSLLQKFQENKTLLREAGQKAGQYITTNAGAVDKVFQAVDFIAIPPFGQAAEHPEYTGLKG